jgi:hypothetical protein
MGLRAVARTGWYAIFSKKEWRADEGKGHRYEGWKARRNLQILFVTSGRSDRLLQSKQLDWRICLIKRKNRAQQTIY